MSVSTQPLIREPAPLAALARRRDYPWLVVACTCTGAFAGQVDASIVQLGLPALERAFAAPLDQVSWVAIAYVLAFAAALPIHARLAEIAGRKLLYIAGFVLFGLFSLLCGLAPDLPTLIAARACQGISGALLGANSVAILVQAAGPARRGRAIGVFAAAQAVGVSVGPAAGGLLLGALSWHWLFWVTVPFAALGAIMGWLVVPLSTRIGDDTRFDMLGALLLAPGLVALLLAITELHAWGWQSPALLGAAAAAPLLLALFVWRELRCPAPLLDLRLFRAPAFAGGTIAVLLSYAMLYGMFFAMSFALIRAYHETPLAAGLRLTIVPVALGILAPLAGAAGRHARAVMLAAMALCLAAVLALIRVLDGTPASLPPLTGALAAYGAGLGVFIAPNNSATLAAAPADRAGQAAGLLSLLRVAGTGIGVAAAATLLAARMESAGGAHESTVVAAPAVLLAALRAVMVMLGVAAALTGLAILPRDRRPRSP